jgi:hypothetical protein
MSDIRIMRPVLHFPRLVIWHNGDQHNKDRGNWFYRDADGGLHGPFLSRELARDDMTLRATGCSVAMRTPFERNGNWWWKKDTAEGPKIEGPYTTLDETIITIRQHIHSLKDQSNVYR